MDYLVKVAIVVVVGNCLKGLKYVPQINVKSYFLPVRCVPSIGSAPPPDSDKSANKFIWDGFDDIVAPSPLPPPPLSRCRNIAGGGEDSGLN